MTNDSALSCIHRPTHGDHGRRALRVRPGRRGRLSALRVFLCKSVLYGAFVWARRVLNHQKRRFLAWAVTNPADPTFAFHSAWDIFLRTAADGPGIPSRASLSLSADNHLSVLINSYDRMYLLVRSMEMGT